MNSAAERLSSLRNAMKENGINTYIISSSDPHLGEYVPDHWLVIPWLTGFTGSAATVVITDSFAGLWTDSRYLMQAELQLSGSGITLVKPSAKAPNTPDDWIKENTPDSAVIGLDGRLFSITFIRKLENLLKGSSIRIDTEQDLISSLWADRPSMPANKAFEHGIDFCGVSRDDKIRRVREKMKEAKVNYHLLTSPDDIMWLLNIRGGDIRYAPLLESFAIVSEDQILFFADESKIPLKMASEFDRLGIVMIPYEETAAILSSLSDNSSILITPSTTSAALYRSIPQEVTIREDRSIPSGLKAIKNSTEISNIARAVIKDGVALTKLFFWLEHYSGKEPLTELSVSSKIGGLRAEQPDFLGPSFRTIAAYNQHGALPHYSATPETDSVITGNGILLIDSGGQYLDGTTDITRTIVLGIPSTQQKKDFTLVLKGMIALANAKFPSTTKGIQLDILARKGLWEHGLNYGHGTGHGVGFCLNVHEGPQSIGPGANPDSRTVIEPGMLTSNEPAVYREGEYGIRTENLILCYEDEETEFGKFLRFDTVSLCYIDKKLIDNKLLESHEIEWLNRYHSEVYEKLHQHLTSQEQLWLREKTNPL